MHVAQGLVIQSSMVADAAPGGSDAIHTYAYRHRFDGEALIVLPGLETLACQGLAVPQEVMHHVVRVESSFNPYAIGVVGGRLARQPKTLPEALSTVRMLEQKGYNFSIGLAQVNRYNLEKYGLQSYERAFEPCANLIAGSRILAECYSRSGGDWGKSFSCYYSGNFSTGFRHGYVQKIYASIRQGREFDEETPNAQAIAVVGRESRRVVPVTRHPLYQDGTPQPASGEEGFALDHGSAQSFNPLGAIGSEAKPARPSRVEVIASRRSSVEPASNQGGDPAYVASQAAPAQASAASQMAPSVAPSASAPAPEAAGVVASAQRPRGPVVLQPYSNPVPASALPDTASAPAPAPRVSVPPIDRAPRKTDEAFVF